MAVDWGEWTLFLYILMRMGGFVLFSPIWGRSGIPNLWKTGCIFALSVCVGSIYDGTAAVPATLVELCLRLFLELGMGFLASVILNLFLYIADQAGEVIDVQMGMSMAQHYDPGAHASLTTSARLLRTLMILIFFAGNGHLTLLRLLLTSGEVVPFGAASLGEAAANRVVELFVECTLLSVKLCMPILAAELLGEVGMGILMKAIPQINVFAINIELKVIIGLVMLLLLLTPMSEFLLETEAHMLEELRSALTLAAG